MPYKFPQTFLKGVNLDLDELSLPKDMVQFMKNMTAAVNQNPQNQAKSGANAGVWTPMEGNEILVIGELPVGDNTCIGFYSSDETNEGYFFLHNSLGSHSVWVISGDNGSVTKVYEDFNLPFTLEPEYFMSSGRVTMQLKSYIDQETGEEVNFKFLIFTNNTLSGQFSISVTDSIATNSFTTSPYFDGAGLFYDRDTLVSLGVPTPTSCIGVNEVPSVPEDADKQNMLVRNGYQFRVKFIDVFGRESIHGIISNAWVSIVGGGCISPSSSTPRCLLLDFDGGNPLVDYIQIEYRKWVGNDRSGALQTGWINHETITKWVHAPGVRWYNRAPNTVYYNTLTNKITYTFCADKNCQPVPEQETVLVEPGVPRSSTGVFAPNKRIALLNNVRGFQPIVPEELEKINIFPSIPETPPCSAPLVRTILLYANIYNPLSDDSGKIRNSFTKVVFGNEDGDCGGGTLNSFKVDQVFGDQDNPGFIFYMAGTQYYCIAEYGSLNIVTGVFTSNPDFVVLDPSLGQPMLRIVMRVPAGKYVMRAASHKAKATDTNYQQTSTYIAGYTTLGAAFTPLDRRNYAQNPIKELVIDCTLADVYYTSALSPMFVILDLSGGASGPIDGYLCEQEGQRVPIEMSPISWRLNGASPGTDIGYGSFFTDHNGFYFAKSAGAGISAVDIVLSVCDGGSYEPPITIINYLGLGILHGNGSGAGGCGGFSGNWYNAVFVAGPTWLMPEYPAAARRTIEQSMLLCDSETGLQNSPIVMTKGATGVTDANGKVILVAHNRYDYLSVPFPGAPPYVFLSNLLPDYSTAPESGDQLIFGQLGACRWTACGGCDSYLPNADVDYVACGGDRDTVLDDVFVSLVSSGSKGVQTGGKYGVGIFLYDNIGRRTFVQVRQGENGFVTMPNINDTFNAPYPAVMLSRIGYNIDPSFLVPSVFKKMTFCVTENTIFSDFLSWSADYVQFIDNTGTTNTVNPTRARIYYGSLNEYKKVNNNLVNCSWQFLTTNTNGTQSSTSGDTVQFLMNGNGSFLPMGLTLPVTYDSSGLFFTVDFVAELLSVTNGCLFRIIRPKSCQTNYIYYEQCKVIDIVDGRISDADRIGIIPYFDSYLLSRLLPVPILQGQPGPLAPGATPPNPIEYTSTDLDSVLAGSGYATNNLANNNNVLVMSVNDATTAYPFFFESPSPSDFWGSHLANRGRVGAANPYEAQRRIGTEVALSATTTDRSNLAGFSYFEDKNIYEFDRNTWGNLNAAFMEVGRVLFICESDHFLSGFNQSQLSVGTDGLVSATNQYGPFTSPQRPSGTPFGCTNINLNSISKYLGKVIWLDSEGRLIQNNFNASRDISTFDPEGGIIGGYSGYLMNKLAYMNLANRTPGNLYYPVSGIDPRTGEYNLTFFIQKSVEEGITRSYINNEPSLSLPLNETMAVDFESGLLKGFRSYTGEMYGNIGSYYSGRNFFSFKEGFPYKHHQGAALTGVTYANYYGEQCPCYVIPVVNPEPDTVKRYLWIEIYTKETLPGLPTELSQPLFYIPSVVSENGQVSRVLISQFEIRNDFQAAAYLCDIATPPDPNMPVQTGIHAITDGNPLIGRWLKPIIKTSDSWAGTYFELSSIINGLNGIKISGDK